MSKERGRKLRNAGINQVARNTPQWWAQQAQIAIVKLAKTGKEFNAEDVRRMVGDPPNHPNAMGAQFLRASQLGVIERVGWETPERQRSHARQFGRWVGVKNSLTPSI